MYPQRHTHLPTSAEDVVAVPIHRSESDAAREAARRDPVREERLSMSAGAVGLVKRGDPRPSPLPW